MNDQEHTPFVSCITLFELSEELFTNNVKPYLLGANNCSVPFRPVRAGTLRDIDPGGLIRHSRRNAMLPAGDSSSKTVMGELPPKQLRRCAFLSDVVILLLSSHYGWL